MGKENETCYSETFEVCILGAYFWYDLAPVPAKAIVFLFGLGIHSTLDTGENESLNIRHFKGEEGATHIRRITQGMKTDTLSSTESMRTAIHKYFIS